MKQIILLGLMAILLYGVGYLIWDGRHMYPRGRSWQRHVTSVIAILGIGLTLIAIIGAAF